MEAHISSYDKLFQFVLEIPGFHMQINIKIFWKKKQAITVREDLCLLLGYPTPSGSDPWRATIQQVFCPTRYTAAFSGGPRL